jgi:uncharacterized protein YcfJ
MTNNPNGTFVKHLAIIVSVLILTQTNAQAFDAIATVVSASPIAETVNRPTQQCWTDTAQVAQPNPEPRNIGGAVIGTIVGGLLGSTIGRGNGRVAATAVGAGVGAVTGDAVANQNGGSTTIATVPVQHCQQVDNFQNVITGYMVTYEYGGQRFSTRLPYNPGAQTRVSVAVSPK